MAGARMNLPSPQICTTVRQGPVHLYSDSSERISRHSFCNVIISGVRFGPFERHYSSEGKIDMTTTERAERAEYNRGCQDGLSQNGCNDRATNTQGPLTVLGLCFREHAGAYACGYQDAIDYKGLVIIDDEIVPA